MVSEKTKSNFAAIIALFFIFGILFMIIDEGVGYVFGIGLLLFLFALIVMIFAGVWSVANSLDRMTRRF